MKRGVYLHSFHVDDITSPISHILKKEYTELWGGHYSEMLQGFIKIISDMEEIDDRYNSFQFLVLNTSAVGTNANGNLDMSEKIEENLIYIPLVNSRLLTFSDFAVQSLKEFCSIGFNNNLCKLDGANFIPYIDNGKEGYIGINDIQKYHKYENYILLHIVHNVTSGDPKIPSKEELMKINHFSNKDIVRSSRNDKEHIGLFNHMEIYETVKKSFQLYNENQRLKRMGEEVGIYNF